MKTLTPPDLDGVEDAARRAVEYWTKGESHAAGTLAAGICCNDVPRLVKAIRALTEHNNNLTNAMEQVRTLAAPHAKRGTNTETNYGRRIHEIASAHRA